MNGKLMRHLVHGWKAACATFYVFTVACAMIGFAAARGAENDKGKRPTILRESQALQHEHLKTKLKAGTPAGKTFQFQGGSAASGVPMLRAANLLFQKPVLRTAQANDPAQYDHLFDLEGNQFAVQVPPGARALMIKLQGRTRNGDVDLAVRFGRPVETIDSKLICDYRDDSNANDLIACTITPNLGAQPLQPGLWYVAVGNGASLAADYALSADLAAYGARIDEMMLQIDDGSYDQRVGFTAGIPSAYFLNRLTPPSYPATLKSIQIYFGKHSGGLAVRERIRLLAGINPSGSSNIDGITFDSVESSVGFLDGFNRYDLPKPLTLRSGDFIVGYEAGNGSNIYPAYQDTSSLSRLRSYISCDGLSFTIMEQLGTELSGSLSIRALISLDVTGSGNSNALPLIPTIGDPYITNLPQQLERKNSHESSMDGIRPDAPRKLVTPINHGANNQMMKSGGASLLPAAQSQIPAAMAYHPDGTEYPVTGGRASSGKMAQSTGWIMNPAEGMAAGKFAHNSVKAGFRIKSGEAKPAGPKGVSQLRKSGSKKANLQSGLWLAAIGGILARMASFIIGKR